MADRTRSLAIHARLLLGAALAAGRQVVAPTLGLSAAIGATLCVAMAASSPRADRIAALFPPWWTAARAMEAAASAGDVVDVGRLSSFTIVRADRPGLAGRLRAAGALLTLDASAIGGCGSSKRKAAT